MTTPALGRLQRVDLRTAWKNESVHFTPWLAQPDNLALLADALGLGADALELQGQEQAVGPFRADLLCRNTEDNSLVLIENQLERTDHGHLGQLLTYAAGLKAVTLVWLAERFTDEHRAVLDWLNEITDDGFGIFGLEIELWRIGDSPMAPKFNVVAQPNEWTRTVQKAGHAGTASTPVTQMQMAFWGAFGEYLASMKAPFKPPKSARSNWYGWGLGKAGLSVLALVNSGDLSVGIEVNSREHPTWFAKLRASEAAVEARVGFALEWDEKPGKKFSRIRCRRDLDMHDEANWPDAHRWLLERMTKLRDAFRQLAQALDDDHPDE